LRPSTPSSAALPDRRTDIGEMPMATLMKASLPWIRTWCLSSGRRRTIGRIDGGVKAGAQGARFILLAAKPIGEPVVQYGPFVMNTQDEIRRAIADHRGRTVRRTRCRPLNARQENRR